MKTNSSQLSAVLLAALVIPFPAAAAPPLRMMVPDFLLSASTPPAGCLQAAGLPVILESYPAAGLLGALTNNIRGGNPPALAVVSDSALQTLNTQGWLYHFTLDQAYSPVRSGTDILGVRLPWAHQWTAIIPATSSQHLLALQVLTNSCIWYRPLDQVEEYAALGSLLASNGFTLSGPQQWSMTKTLGGIPLEITVVPAYSQEGDYYRLIIARDHQGKVYAETERLPASTSVTAPVRAATLRAFQYSSYASTVSLQGNADPGYCSKAEPACVEGVFNAIQKFLNWVAGLTQEEKALLKLKGAPSVGVRFNQDLQYAWGSRLRAWKIYKAMLTTDGQNWRRSVGCTCTRVKNTITDGKGRSFVEFLVHGFDLKGRQKLTLVPPGCMFWNDRKATSLQSHLQAVQVSIGQMATSACVALAAGPGVNYAASDDATAEADATWLGQFSILMTI